jgi:DNA-binding IscR family transcriptional regulator
VGEPGEITLRDVYRAIEDEQLFPLHHRPPNPDCRVGRHIQEALTGHFVAATRAMEHELAHTTIAGMLSEVLAHSG